MGKLRIEPKVKPPLTDKDYEEYRAILNEALKAASDNHVYWDLDQEETSNKVRKAFLYVAEKEGIALRVRRLRNSGSLALSFGGASQSTRSRIPAAETEKRILNVLNVAKVPLQKSEIIEKTGISASTWNVRIRDLLARKKVVRHGRGRETRYSGK